MGCGQSQVRASDEKPISVTPDPKRKRRKKSGADKKQQRKSCGFQEIVPNHNNNNNNNSGSPSASNETKKGKRKKKKKRTDAKDNTNDDPPPAEETPPTEKPTRKSLIPNESEGELSRRNDSGYNLVDKGQIKVKIFSWLAEIEPPIDCESPVVIIESDVASSSRSSHRSSQASDIQVNKLNFSETDDSHRPSLSVAELACVPKASWHQSCTASTIVQSGEEWMYQLDELQKEYETEKQKKV